MIHIRQVFRPALFDSGAHCGQSAFGCSSQQMHSEWTANNPETRANRFASDLLLPVSMFAPLAAGKPVTTETVSHSPRSSR